MSWNYLRPYRYDSVTTRVQVETTRAGITPADAALRFCESNTRQSAFHEDNTFEQPRILLRFNNAGTTKILIVSIGKVDFLSSISTKLRKITGILEVIILLSNWFIIRTFSWLKLPGKMFNNIRFLKTMIRYLCCQCDSSWLCLNLKLYHECKSYVRRQGGKRIILVLKTKYAATML